MNYTPKDNHIDSAKELDQKDELNYLRKEFFFPKNKVPEYVQILDSDDNG